MASPAPRSRRRRAAAVAGALACAAAVLAGCSDDDGDGKDPVVLLNDAKKTLDDASSVHVVITGRDVPGNAEALEKADGVATHAPAFKGKLTVRSGAPIDADVVAVSGKVFAKIAFAPTYVEIKPEQLRAFGAPDPADLLDQDKGITSLLPAVKDPQIEGESREGDKVLTEVSGAIEGPRLAGLFPPAPGDREFAATFKIDESSRQLVSAVISGPFYADGTTTSYDLILDKYGEQVEISAP